MLRSFVLYNMRWDFHFKLIRGGYKAPTIVAEVRREQTLKPHVLPEPGMITGLALLSCGVRLIFSSVLGEGCWDGLDLKLAMHECCTEALWDGTAAFSDSIDALSGPVCTIYFVLVPYWTVLMPCWGLSAPSTLYLCLIGQC